MPTSHKRQPSVSAYMFDPAETSLAVDSANNTLFISNQFGVSFVTKQNECTLHKPDTESEAVVCFSNSPCYSEVDSRHFEGFLNGQYDPNTKLHSLSYSSSAILAQSQV